MKLITNPQDIVQFNTKIEKDLSKLPVHILNKLRMWVDLLKHKVVAKVRKISGFHDEPLSGERKYQCSIRLNKAYRAIYIEDMNTITVTIIEVNKHEY